MSGAISRNESSSAEAPHRVANAPKRGDSAANPSRFAPMLGELMSAAALHVEALPPERSPIAPDQPRDNNAEPASSAEQAQREEPSASKPAEVSPEGGVDLLAAEQLPSDQPIADQHRQHRQQVDEEADQNEVPANLLVAAPPQPKSEAPLPDNSEPTSSANSGDSTLEDTDLAQDEGVFQDSGDAELVQSSDADSVDAPAEGDPTDMLAEPKKPQGRDDQARQASRDNAAPSDQAPKFTRAASDAQVTPPVTQEAPEAAGHEATSPDADAPQRQAGDPLFGELREAGRTRVQHLQNAASGEIPRESSVPTFADTSASTVPNLEPETAQPTPSTLVNLSTGAAVQAIAASGLGLTTGATQPSTSGTSSPANSGGVANVQAAAPADSANNSGQQNNNQNGNLNGNNQQEAVAASRAQRAGRASRTMQQRSIEIVQQVAKAIGLRAAGSSTGNVTLLLRPEALGTLRLDLSYGEDGRLSITGSAESELARQMLGGNVDQLRQALRQENIDLARFQLEQQFSQQHQQNPSASGQDQRQGNKARGSAAGRVAGDLVTPSTTTENDVIHSNRISPGAVNIRA